MSDVQLEYEKMKVPALKELLTKSNLDTSGLKGKLYRRLPSRPSSLSTHDAGNWQREEERNRAIEELISWMDADN